MILLYIFAFTLVAASQSVPAEGFDQVLPRDTGHPPFAPLIFHNLTKQEFIAKREEVRRRLAKREVFGDEVRNDYFTQQTLEARNVKCEERFGTTHRFASGYCHADRPRFLGITCRHRTERAARNIRLRASETCVSPQKCDVIFGWNFYGNRVRIPHCVDVIEINERTSANADPVPEYEGSMRVPSPASDAQAPPHSPSILDSIDQIWEVEDGHIPGLTAQWDYRGAYSNGNGFSSRSFGMAHSWSCIGCPSGTLYVSTVGFRAQALGSVLTSGL